MNLPLYEYSLCVALPLMIFFSAYFLLAPTPDKAIFANYLRSRRIMDCALLLLAANYAVHFFFEIRFRDVHAAILMNPQTWVASGHLGGFSDPLMDCKECHERFRADKLIEDYCEERGIALDGSVDGWSQEPMTAFIEAHQIPCPTCGKHKVTDIRQFNLMFKTCQGMTEDAKNTV